VIKKMRRTLKKKQRDFHMADQFSNAVRKAEEIMVRDHRTGSPKLLTIHRNPTPADIAAISRGGKRLRFSVEAATGDLRVWVGSEADHAQLVYYDQANGAERHPLFGNIRNGKVEFPGIGRNDLLDIPIEHVENISPALANLMREPIVAERGADGAATTERE
jgi:hypothetical protein